jgi:ABC-type multidrug transport system permease subunit
MIVDILFSFILFASGIIIIIDKKFSWKGKIIDLSNYNLYIMIGGILILFGIMYLNSSFKKKYKR